MFQHISDRVLKQNEWQPDSQHKMCQECGKSFSMFVGKHHCRYCGRVLCDACSSLKVKNLRTCKKNIGTYPQKSRKDKKNTFSLVERSMNLSQK